MSEVWKSTNGDVPEGEALWVYANDGMRHIARLVGSDWDWKKLRYYQKWELLWPPYNADRDKGKLIKFWMHLPEPPSDALHPVTLNKMNVDDEAIGME